MVIRFKALRPMTVMARMLLLGFVKSDEVLRLTMMLMTILQSMLCGQLDGEYR